MANMAVEFESWLKDKGVKNFTPSFCVAIIDKISKYSAKKNTLQAFVKPPAGIFAITDWKLFNQLRAKLAGDKVFRMIDKQTYKAFDKIGNYYTQFLKDVESGRFELSIIEVAEDAEESSSQIESRGKTISEAAIEVLKQSQPRTIKQIYEIIVKQNLYIFKAAQPLGVLTSEIRSRCEGVELPSRSGMFPNKSFRLAGVVMGEQLYALADADDKRKEASQTTALEWNDTVAEQFKRFLLASSKAEGTAQSYKSNMSWVVRNFFEQWAEAQKKESATKGIFYFIAVVSSDERFKAANITAHNQYSAAMNQFLNYINNCGIVVTDTTNGKVSRRSSKKERAVGSAKTLDWENLEPLEFAKPFSIKIQGFSNTEDKVIPVSSWKQVLRKLARIIFSEGIDTDLTDFTYSKSKRAIFGFGEESVDYAKTVCEERDFWVCLNWSADNSVGICKELMDYCDISYDSIEVIYIEGDSSMGAREVEVTIDINKIAIKERKIIDFIGEHFKNGVRLEALEIADVVARLNEAGFDYESEEHLKRILRNNLFEIEGRYFHINSLLIGVSIEEILETLQDNFRNGYQRIYTGRLFEHYRDKLSEDMTPVMLGRIISRVSGKIRLNEKSGFLRIGAFADKGADDEIRKAVVKLLESNPGQTLQQIMDSDELRFYALDRVEWMLRLSEKRQKNSWAWEWRLIFIHTDLYYHVSDIYFSDNELEKIKEVARSLFGDEILNQQADIVRDVANFLKNNNYAEKKSVIKKLVECADALAPKDELDYNELYIKLKADNVADISSLINSHGEIGVKKALEFKLGGKDFVPDDELEDDSDEEVEDNV